MQPNPFGVLQNGRWNLTDYSVEEGNSEFGSQYQAVRCIVERP